MLKRPPCLLVDEAGVGPESEALLWELIAVYQAGNEECRQGIRKLFARCEAFTGAACVRINPEPTDGFRLGLLLFSMRDQWPDGREALRTLRLSCWLARKQGLDRAPVLREVAEMSSDLDKHGMGSTKEMLSNASSLARDEHHRMVPGPPTQSWRHDLEAISFLKECALTDECYFRRLAAVQEFAWACRHDYALPILKERISADESACIRQFLVRQLAHSWKSDPDTLPLLKERARIDVSATVRAAAAQELLRRWSDDQEV